MASAADPLLTSCCSVCRTNPPRYKCPRCNIPYCSVPCNRRHRARAGCSGIRDVTTFVPRARLCTAAGIDRDYNFLQGIDVARTSAVKHVVDERHVLRPNDVVARVINEADPNEANNDKKNQNNKYNKYGKHNNNKKGPHGPHGKNNQQRPHNGPALVKHWAGDEVVYLPARPKLTGAAAAVAAEAAAVVASARAGEDNGATDEAFPALRNDTFMSLPTIPTYESATSIRVKGLCRRDNIELLGAPRGFARQRENNTTVATETTTSKDGGKVSNVHLHWQVEWLVYSADGETPVRVMRRALDDTPLYKAYAALQQAERKREGKQGKLGVTTLINEVVDNESENDNENDIDNDNMDTRGDDDGEVTITLARTPMSRKQKQQQKQQQRQQQQQAAKKLAPPSPTAPFHNAFFYSYDVQNSTTGAWHTRTMKDDTTVEEVLDANANANDNPAQRAARSNFNYYLLRPRVPGVASHNKDKELIPLSATDTLATALPGRSVLEFPTIYILPKDSALPAGHALGSTERKVFTFPEPAAPNADKGKKLNGFLKRRQDGGKEVAASTPAAKKRKTGGGDNDEDDEDKDSEDADVDMEAIAAQLLESETSSSGSDSSDEDSESEGKEEEEDEEGFVEDEEEEPGFNGRLPELLHGLGSTGTLPADGKPKLVVYDSWSEGSDEE